MIDLHPVAQISLIEKLIHRKLNPAVSGVYKIYMGPQAIVEITILESCFIIDTYYPDKIKISVYSMKATTFRGFGNRSSRREM